MTPEQEIQALRAELAAERANVKRLTAAVEDMARRERERDALRVEQEREAERQRALRRERNARHRAARRRGDAGETLVRRHGDVSETSHPSLSSPPLDGSPLSSQTQHSPLLYPLPSSPSPLSGSEPRPPVSHTSAERKGVANADTPGVHPEDEAAVERLSPAGESPPPSLAPRPSGPPEWPPALRLEVQAAPKATRTRKPSAAERLYAQLEATRKARCEERGVAFVAEDWAPARQNTNLGRFAQLEPAEQERFEAAWAEYLSDDAGAVRNPPWSLGWFLASKSTWESKALRGAS